MFATIILLYCIFLLLEKSIKKDSNSKTYKHIIKMLTIKYY